MADSDWVEKLHEILENFPSLRIPIAELRNLSTETVVNIYQEALKALGIDIRNLRKPLKSETQFHMSYYDTDFRFIMKLHSLLTLVFKETSSNIDFDVMDILNPGINRTYVAVTILHNISVFRASRKEELDEIAAQGNAGMDKYKKLAAQKERLRNEINYTSKQKAELSMLQDKLKSQVSDAEERVFTLIEERENLKETLEPLSKTLAEYDSKISKPETEGIKLGQKIEKLKNQIVTSPDQLIHTLEHLRATEQQKKEEELIISEQLQDKKSRYEKLANCAQLGNAVSEEIKDISKLIEEIRNHEMELERFETEKTKLSEEVSVKKEIVRCIKDTEADLQQQINTLEEFKADKNKKAEKKMIELGKKIAQDVRAIEEYKHRKQDCAKEIEEYKIKIIKEEENQSYVLSKLTKESQDIIQEVQELTHAFNHLSQTLPDV